MYEQKLFNMALKHICEQGKPSLQNGSCVYRNPDGLQCAFGPAIKKNAYDPILENKCADVLINRFQSHLYKWVTEVEPDVASSVQLCHDAAAIESKKGEGDFLELFKKKMRQTAEIYELKYKEPS